jgi:hypothetical protein
MPQKLVDGRPLRWVGLHHVLQQARQRRRQPGHQLGGQLACPQDTGSDTKKEQTEREQRDDNNVPLRRTCHPGPEPGNSRPHTTSSRLTPRLKMSAGRPK